MPDPDIIRQEASWTAVRSSGAGGQHVNKTASKVVVSFDLAGSAAFTEEEKQRALKKLEPRLTKAGELILESSTSRSQHQNREEAFRRLETLLTEAVKRPKPRKKTAPSRASKLRRLREKKIRSEKKSGRKKPSP